MFEVFCKALKENDLENIKRTFDPSYLNNEISGMPPLCRAANDGMYDIVHFFIKNNANVEIVSKFNGLNSLHWAASNGRTEVVKLLIEAGAKSESQSPKGFRPIHFAVVGNHFDTLRYLLSLGVDLSAKMNDSRTIIDIMQQNNYFECEEVYNKWIKFDSEIFKIIDEINIKKLKETFLHEKIDVKDPVTGLAVLDYAVERKSIACLNYMLDNPNIQEDKLIKSLENLIKQNYLSSTFLRLQYRFYRAIVFNVQDQFDFVSVAVMNSKWPLTQESFLLLCIRLKRKSYIKQLLPLILEIDDELWTTSIECAKENNMNDIAEELKNRRQYLEKRYQIGYHRIHIAIQDNSFSVVEYLLSNDHATGNESNHLFVPPPLNLALSLSYYPIVKYLLSENVDVDFVDKDGRTPLHLALMNKEFQIAEILIDRMNLIDISDCNGMTPLLWAVFFDQEMLCNMLLDKGANIIYQTDKLLDQLNQYAVVTIGKTSESAATLYMKLHRRLPEAFVNLIATNATGDYVNQLLHLACQLLLVETVALFFQRISPAIISANQIMNNNNNNNNMAKPIGNAPLHLLILDSLSSALDNINEGENHNEEFYEIMLILIKNGADVTLQNQDGKSPIELSLNSRRSLSLLLHEGLTSLQISVEHIMDIYWKKWPDILEKIVKIQSKPQLAALLEHCIQGDKGAQMLEFVEFLHEQVSDEVHDWLTIQILFISAFSNNMDIFYRFTEAATATILAQEKDFISQLIRKAPEQFTLTFLKSNSECESLLEQMDSNNESLLTCAASRGYLKLVKYLTLHSTDMNYESSEGSALQILLQKHQTTIEASKLEGLLKTMIKSGANVFSLLKGHYDKMLIDLIQNTLLKKKIEEFAKKEMEKMKKIASENRELMQSCNICTINQIDHALIPCGHTFCSECINKIQLCSICRCKFTGRQKIYITLFEN